jgi:hypothetical protein
MDATGVLLFIRDSFVAYQLAEAHIFGRAVHCYIHAVLGHLCFVPLLCCNRMHV